MNPVSPRRDMPTIIYEIPIKTVSEANSSEHWTQKAKRHALQKKIVRMVLFRDIQKVILPCHIKIVRLSPRSLDYDNLVSSQKYVLDSICDMLIPGLAPGRADSDKRISTEYDQKKTSTMGVEIQITYSEPQKLTEIDFNDKKNPSVPKHRQACDLAL